MKQKKLIVVITIILLLMMVSSCKKNKENESKEDKNMNEKIYAQIEFSTHDVVNLELYPDKAPLSVDNFVKLANSDYYKGSIFHRVIANFMIQIGGYYLDGNNLCEMPETSSIQGEFKSNGWDKNDLHHELGVISMARTSDPNSATAQFFLCAADCDWLDGDYAAFGKTTDEASNQVILKISKMQTYNIGGGFTDFPVDPISIVKVSIKNEPF